MLMFGALLQIFAAGCDTQNFFGIPPWYKYLVSSGRMTATGTGCEISGAFDWKPDGGSDIILILFGILDMMLRISAYVAIGFILWGAIQYITSDGQPDRTKNAQSTIINALVGLVIAMVATAAVSFFGRTLST
jgi:hypothetical protein